MTSMLPVAVTKMSARVTASSIVTTSKPSIAACSAQIGSTSVTSTRAPPLRSDAAEPLPTSPKPATQATLPASITSVARRMASTSAFLAAVEIVELRLGDAVVDVDRRERQLALLAQLIQAVDAGGGLFRDALDVGDGLGEIARTLLEEALERRGEDFLFLVGRRRTALRRPRPARPTKRTWSRRRRRRGSGCRSRPGPSRRCCAA